MSALISTLPAHDGCLRFLKTGLVSAVLAITLFAAPLEAQRRGKQRMQQTTLFDANHQIGTIYYPANADAKDPERKAAETLAHYLEKISAQKWDIAPEPTTLEKDGIFIGRTRRAFVDGLWRNNRQEGATTLPTDRIEVEVKRNRLLIVGENPQATLSGVYRFLQTQAGADWFAPGELGEEIPEHSELRLTQKTHHWQPDFRDRQYYSMTTTPGFGRWKEQMGASTHFSFNHNLHRIFTPEVYAKHPEYWASINGVRPKPGRNERSSVQLDYTNPELARITAAAANEHFAQNPDKLTFSLGIHDTIDFGNDAATLEVVSPFRYWRGHPVFSDLIFSFTNDVAREVAQAHPDRYLPVLAYMWGEAPPAFLLEPNIFPYLCIDHSQWYDSDRKLSDMELARQWADSGATQLGSWMYYQGSGFFIPRLFTEQSAQSLKFVHSLGYDSIFFEDGANTGFDAPKMWLAAQLTWDVDADPAALLSHFYHGYYGAAATPMQQFFELCERQWMQQQGRTFWLKYFLDIAQAELYPPEVLAQLQSLLDEAKSALCAADAPERFFQRLQLTADSFAYLKAASDFYHAYRELLLMPLDSVADVERFDRQYAVFTQARNALKDAPQIQLRFGWDLRAQMLQYAPAGRLLHAFHKAGSELPANALAQSNLFPAAAATTQPVFIETFSNTLVEGDCEGIGPMAPSKEQVAEDWNIRWTHHQGAHLQRIVPQQPTKTTGGTETTDETETAEGELPMLKLQNQEFFSIYRWLPVPEGATGAGFSIEVMGELGKGSRTQISLSWLDADHKPVGETVSNILPPENYPAWHGAAVAAQVPEGAKWFYIGFRLRQQEPEKPLYLRSWQAFTW